MHTYSCPGTCKHTHTNNSTSTVAVTIVIKEHPYISVCEQMLNMCMHVHTHFIIKAHTRLGKVKMKT